LELTTRRQSRLGAATRDWRYDRDMEHLLLTMRRGDLASMSCIESSAVAAKRLADLGFISGARIEMVRPGSPCIVRIDDGTCIGLGAEHQRRIRIRRPAV